MDYLTSGNSCINEGTSLVAWGAFLVSLGWVLVGKYRAIDRGLSRVQFFRKIFIQEILEILIFAGICTSIIIGLKNIGDGSTLTTKGWNLLNKYEQKRALIFTVARTWKRNDILGKAIENSYTTVRKENYRRPFIVPRLANEELKRVTSSELFDMQIQNDAELLIATINYDYIIEITNQFLEAMNHNLSSLVITQPYIELKYDSFFGENGPYKEFKTWHKKLAVVLEKKHNWALEDLRLIGYPEPQI